MKKAGKILYILSFLPASALLVIAVVSMLTGISFFSSRAYGFSAFVLTLLNGIYTLCVIPVLPVCVVYQLSYLIAPRFKRYTNWIDKKIAVSFFIVGIIAVGCVLILTHTSSISRFFEEKNAQSFYDNADERINFRLNEEHYNGILGIEEQKTNCMLLDYKSRTIGFLICVDYDKFYSYEMKECTADDETELNGMRIQAELPLADGGRILFFCPDEANRHRTSALLWITGKGEKYCRLSVHDKNDDPAVLGVLGSGIITDSQWMLYSEYKTKQQGG